jgi:hypothetical protein
VVKVAAVVAKKSIRRALENASGYNPGKLWDAHHAVPGKFADRMWKELGINVNKFGAWFERTPHRQASRAIQDEWERFLGGDNPTTAAAFDLMYAQAQKYGYQVFLLR